MIKWGTQVTMVKWDALDSDGWLTVNGGDRRVGKGTAIFYVLIVDSNDQAAMEGMACEKRLLSFHDLFQSNPTNAQAKKPDQSNGWMALATLNLEHKRL